SPNGVDARTRRLHQAATGRRSQYRSSRRSETSPRATVTSDSTCHNHCDEVLARLLQSLPPRGVLAVQMPDNTHEPALMLMEKVAASGPWTEAITRANALRNDLPRPEEYYDLLGPACSYVDIWHIYYNHLIENHEGVVEWFKGSGLRPFLAPLDATMSERFIANYTDEIRRAYPARSDGKVMLRFPRLFILAVR